MTLSKLLTGSMMTMALTVGAAGMTGCTNRTEGERTAAQAADIERAADMIKRGEAMERDGARMVADGNELKRQGDNPGGDAKIAEGKAKGKAGEELVQQGRMLRDKAKM